jgi:hypothetical protein
VKHTVIHIYFICEYPVQVNARNAYCGGNYIRKKAYKKYSRKFRILFPSVVISGSLSPQHGASSGCGWRNCLQFGG